MEQRVQRFHPRQWYVVFEDDTTYSTIESSDRQQAFILMKALQAVCRDPRVQFSIAQEKDIPSSSLWGPSSLLLRYNPHADIYKDIAVEVWMRIIQVHPNGALELAHP